MKGSSFGYLLKEGAKNIWVNRIMSVASIGVLVACLLLVGGAMLFTINVNSIVGYVEAQNEVKIFLEDDVSGGDISRINEELAAMPNIGSIDFISAEEGLASYAEGMGAEYNDLLESLKGAENPLPHSFVVKIKDLSIMSDTVAQLEAMDGVYSVNAPMDVASSITGIKYAIAAFGTAIVAILMAVSLLITANTIKITVFNRRKEINIMKYVGATDSFIKLPFVIEGVLLGIISSLIAYGITWLGYNLIISKMTENDTSWLQMAYQNLVPFTDVAVPFLLGFLAAGVIIGTFGSMIFVRKHLKV